MEKIRKKYYKYISQNILGMVGISVYILADTYFISKAAGANGITALNLVLPLYGLIFAIGSMLGVGSAICYSIQKERKNAECGSFFSTALCAALIIGVVIAVIGLCLTQPLIRLLGGTEEIVTLASDYTKIFMGFAPVFMWNYICNAFVRNDHNTFIAMLATLAGSIFNIMMDYVFVFPCGMGMAGAGLATALAPVVGIAVCSTHLLSKKSSVSIQKPKLSVKQVAKFCQLGVAACISEVSNAVITIIYNMIILSISGNTGVAAYGIVANLALVVVAVFNGISQGGQPMLSEAYGKGKTDQVRYLIRLSIKTVLCMSLIVYGLIYLNTDRIIAVFNHENSSILASYASEGIHIYFIGFLFAGFNINGIAALSSVASIRWSFVASIIRGFAAIIIFALILPVFFGMTGVWMAFVAAELVSAILICIPIIGILKTKKGIDTF